MNDDSPVAGDGDSSLLLFDIETRKYIIHLFLGYSEEIENGVLKKNIVNPMTGTLGTTIRTTNGVKCKRAYQDKIPDILKKMSDNYRLTILEDHIQIIDCLIKTKPKNHHRYDEFKKWLTEHNNQQMIFKDAMNSWNKHRIIVVFEGGEIIKKTEEIICLLTGKITDINILNSKIIDLTKLTQPLSENLKLISDYPGYMYNTFIKTPDGKIFDLKRQIYSYILPVCLVNNDNIKKFKDTTSYTVSARFRYKDNNTSKKKELIQKLYEVVDKKTIRKFTFLFKNFLNEIKEAADKATTEAAAKAEADDDAKAEAADKAADAVEAADKAADAVEAAEADDKAEADTYTNLKLYNNMYDEYKAAKAEADKAADDAAKAGISVAAKKAADDAAMKFPVYDTTFNIEKENEDLVLIHKIMKIYTGKEDEEVIEEEVEGYEGDEGDEEDEEDEEVVEVVEGAEVVEVKADVEDEKVVEVVEGVGEVVVEGEEGEEGDG